MRVTLKFANGDLIADYLDPHDRLVRFFPIGMAATHPEEPPGVAFLLLVPLKGCYALYTGSGDQMPKNLHNGEVDFFGLIHEDSSPWAVRLVREYTPGDWNRRIEPLSCTIHIEVS